jgi:hypothetical protein
MKVTEILELAILVIVGLVLGKMGAKALKNYGGVALVA